MPTPPAPNPTSTARLRAAIQSIDWKHDLAALTARQPTPNPSNARQTTPSNTPAQNKPTAPPATAKPALAPLHTPSLAGPNAHQTPPNHANARHNGLPGKTNPTPRKRPPRPLTPKQLRAARLLLAGHSTTATAAALNIDRHTLATWKRLPLFQQELRHLLTAPDLGPRLDSNGCLPPTDP